MNQYIVFMNSGTDKDPR